MRMLPLALAGLVLVAPLSTASQTYNGALLPDNILLVSPVSTIVSSPVLQASANWNAVLGVGDTVTVSVTWADTSGGAAGGNDLDLVLLKPSAAPVPVNVADPVGTATGVAVSRVARQTCTDMAAKSVQHPGGSSEAFSHIVAMGDETGAYSIGLRGFLLTTPQPYSLTVTVTSGGVDVTASRVSTAAPAIFITSAPYCQL